MAKEVIILEGDGIGPEIMQSTLEVLETMKVPINFTPFLAGERALATCGELLPKKTLDAIQFAGIALKGPITTPVGSGFRSINVTLRQHFDLYANIRPVQILPEIQTRYNSVDFVLFRENTEDLYAGIEREVNADCKESIKRITRKGSMRIAYAAFEYAKAHNRKKVTAVHKANIMKLTDGLFLECCEEVSKSFPEITFDDLIVDNTCMQMVKNPEIFDVIVTQNLYGDILSDLGAGLVGGLGVVPGANVGDGIAIFEPVHGSAPDIAGKGVANPLALLLTSALMLSHMGFLLEAEKLRKALSSSLKNQEARTQDIGGSGNTKAFTDEVIKNLEV